MEAHRVSGPETRVRAPSGRKGPPASAGAGRRRGLVCGPQARPYRLRSGEGWWRRRPCVRAGRLSRSVALRPSSWKGQTSWQTLPLPLSSTPDVSTVSRCGGGWRRRPCVRAGRLSRSIALRPASWKGQTSWQTLPLPLSSTPDVSTVSRCGCRACTTTTSVLPPTRIEGRRSEAGGPAGCAQRRACRAASASPGRPRPPARRCRRWERARRPFIG